ncbi:MAG: hypothetical protein IJ572_02240 [Bacilli bacterium]|nr:hypothetical protein [Bacilli bacterium]
MKILNRSIIRYTISLIIFIGVLIGLTVFITIKIIEDNIHKTYQDNGFIIDINPKINKKLDKQLDIDGIYSPFNIINLTNNGKKRKYQIVLTPINNSDANIRVSVNNVLIRYLNNFDKVDDGYLLYENYLNEHYSISHQIRVWQSINSVVDNITVNFNLKVNILDE